MSDYSTFATTYDYPSCAQLPWVRNDTPYPNQAIYVPSQTLSPRHLREMMTPELADTIIELPMQLGICTLQIKRATI